MTIGRTSEAPAAYALTSTIRRLLDHLTEANLYSAKDLESIMHTLDKMSSIVQNTDSSDPPYLAELVGRRVEQCKESIKQLQEKVQMLEAPLPAIHEKLVSILRSMSLANTKPRVRSITFGLFQTLADGQLALFSSNSNSNPPPPPNKRKTKPYRYRSGIAWCRLRLGPALLTVSNSSRPPKCKSTRRSSRRLPKSV